MVNLKICLWQSALHLTLINPDNDFFGSGGEARIAVRENYLCLYTRIPESNRLIAHSTGINPSWWREDLIIWMIRYQAPSSKRNTVLVLAVNPFGAYSLGSVRDIYNISGNDLLTSPPIEWIADILVAAEIGKDEWRTEAAIPLEKLGSIGFLSVERIRAPRINVPELRWHWPALNEQAAIELTSGNIESTPLLKLPDLPDNNADIPQVIPANEFSAEIKALPKQAWSPEEQESLKIREMLEKSLRARMKSAAEEEKRAWQKVKTADDWKQFRDKRLTALLNSIGPLPERTPLKTVVTRRNNSGEGFVIENLVYESRPGLAVTANLYLPEKPSGKIPAIVVVHSHHAPKTQSELQDMGMTWARAGTAVLHYGSALCRRTNPVPTMVSGKLLWKIRSGKPALPCG